MKRTQHPSPWTLLGIIALVLLAVVPRLVWLDRRPLMHDESLFAYYSWQYFDTLRNNTAKGYNIIPYTHIPMLHGPTLMLATGEMFRHFGDSIRTARTMVAIVTLFGMAAALALWPRRYRGWFALLLLTSPILLYFSRFFRDDMLVESANLIATLGIFRAFSRRERYFRPFWGLLGGFFVIFPLALMESALFFQASLFTFTLVWLANRFLWDGWSPELRPYPRQPLAYYRIPGERLIGGKAGRKRRKDSSEPISAPATVQPEMPAPAEPEAPPPAPIADPGQRGPGLFELIPGWLIGALLGIAVVIFVYGITYSPGAPPSDVPNAAQIYNNTPKALQPVMGGLLNLAASWNYWKGQHKEQRIEGAIHYHNVILVIYELPLLLLLAGGLIWDAAQRKKRALFYAAALGIWILFWALWRLISYQSFAVFFDPAKNPHSPPAFLKPLTDFLHVEPNVSMLILGLMIVPLLAWSVLMMREHRPLPAWLGWWGACSLFQYSSAGEKVPWLAMHIVVPLVLAAGWVWAPRLRRMSLTSRQVMIGVLAFSTLIGLRNDWRLLDPFRNQNVINGVDRQGADPRERMVYNHTPAEFDKLAREHIALWQAHGQKIPLKQRNVWLIDAPGWPGVWYYRNCSVHQSAVAPPAMPPDVDLMLGNKDLMDKLAASVDRSKWKVSELSLRDHWWAPWPQEDYGKENMSSPEIIGAWVKYYWLRKTWTDTGGFGLIAIEPVKMRE